VAKRPAKPAPLTAVESEDFEERAAIIEFMAGVPRVEAERQAMAIVLGRREQGRLL
jgi:hypothetical protein